MRPSTTLQAVIDGQLPASDAPQWCQSWLSFWVYQRAAHVLQGKDKTERRSRLDQVPEAVREMVEDEAMRIHLLRR